MPDWLQKLHPAAMLGGLAVMALAALDHQQQGWAKDWSNADWTLLLGGFAAVVGSPLVSGIGNAITGAAVGGAQSAQQPADVVAQLEHAVVTGVTIGQASATTAAAAAGTPAAPVTPAPAPPPAPAPAPDPASNTAPGTNVHS